MVSEKPRVGLIPLYLALYDEVAPRNRALVEAFARRVASRLETMGLVVELGGVCTIRAEVERTAASLASREVDLLATLHLAYSPSLESAEALESSPLPLVLLDTTPDARFAEGATMDDMFRNHGIHGVQDLACVLRRRGRAYSVVAGHVDDEDFLRDVARAARAGRAARHLRLARVLVFGEEFSGMGDFAVAPELLASALNVSMRRLPVSEIASRVARVSEDDLAAEAAADDDRFDCSGVPPGILRASNRVGLAVRGMLAELGANAFSFNFRSFDRAAGMPTVPFLEASKAMARGIGYAGEGDALTAALVRGLLAGFGEVTFTEMFCPDWGGNAIFMSHMGECNVALAAARPCPPAAGEPACPPGRAHRPKLVEKKYVFGEVENPAVAMFPLRAGPATLVNLAPGPNDAFELIACRVRVLERAPQPGFPDAPHFWVEPTDRNLRDFLRRYSECGGTHHLALVLGDELAAMRRMAQMLELRFEEI